MGGGSNMHVVMLDHELFALLQFLHTHSTLIYFSYLRQARLHNLCIVISASIGVINSVDFKRLIFVDQATSRIISNV